MFLVNNNNVSCDVINDVDNNSDQVSSTCNVLFDDLVKHASTDDLGLQPVSIKKFIFGLIMPSLAIPMIPFNYFKITL